MPSKQPLMSEKKSCWEEWDKKTIQSVFAFGDEYKRFLDRSKTEKEAITAGVKMIKAAGYKNISELKSIKPGDKVYAVNRDRCLAVAKIGQDITQGLSLIMSHVDAPHLDFKVKPLYEDEGLAFFKTHYYGGIKKYQWPTIALALHGSVFLANGKSIELTIGEKNDEPIFMITDLLPHLDRAGGPNTAVRNREVQGEDLNVLIGSVPSGDKKSKERVKLAIIQYLNKNFGICEEDLSSMDLQAVPSEKARDIGFDQSMISGYGHDDRSCSFAALRALLESNENEKTQACLWVDREEIGSEGNTGARSTFFSLFISDLLQLSGKPNSMNAVYRIFSRTNAISADVTAAIDPDYKDVHDLRNSPRLGHGVVIEKYTGSRGKYDTSDASAEFIQKIRVALGKTSLPYQLSGGMGKVDLGGGGTIAKYMANLNMEIVDMGVPAFNVHAPLEIISKADLYSAFMAYKALLEKM